jgi:hypothetical protein
MPEHGSLREKIAAEKIEKEQRQERFKALYENARYGGLHAGYNLGGIEPMVVIQRANPWDDTSPVVKQYEPVADGLCGFAWVDLHINKQATPEQQTEARQFINWLKGTQKPSRPDLAPPAHNGHKGYYGGWQLWVSDHDQSHARKCAHAREMAHLLRIGIPGLNAYPGERLD